MSSGVPAPRFLSLEDLLLIAQIATDGGLAVRDAGLLDSAAHRPQTTLFGEDAYATLTEKAAALLESLVRNRALVDGNKRTGWLACCSFLELNGVIVDATDDDAFDLVIAIAEGRIELDQIAEKLEHWSAPAVD